MAWYRSGMANDPPGIAMPKLKSPYKYPGANEDLVRSMGQTAQADQELASQQANSAYGLQRLDQMRNLVLGGLQQQNEAVQNRQQLGTSQLGVLNNLLSNLFR